MDTMLLQRALLESYAEDSSEVHSSKFKLWTQMVVLSSDFFKNSHALDVAAFKGFSLKFNHHQLNDVS